MARLSRILDTVDIISAHGIMQRPVPLCHAVVGRYSNSSGSHGAEGHRRTPCEGASAIKAGMSIHARQLCLNDMYFSYRFQMYFSPRAELLVFFILFYVQRDFPILRGT